MTEDLKIKVWEKGRIVNGLAPQEYRKDACGALMIFSKFGKTDDEFGWSVDHIYPQSKGGDDRLENLRPMQVSNATSKGDDFPVYFRAVKMVDNRNIANRAQCRVSEKLTAKINELYGCQY